MNSILDDPFIDPEALRQANELHDAEMRRLGISIKNPGRVGSGWKPQSLIRNGKLTDKKIDKYSKAGYYSAEYRAARFKKSQMVKQSKHMNRVSGGFFEHEGRLIYNPL